MCESSPELELGVCWQETLVVGWAAEGLLAPSGIKGRSVSGSHFAKEERGKTVMRR